VSLVIEALRRVEKTDARAGSIGAFVASYRPVPTPRRSPVPLLLGLLTGGVLVFLFTAPGRNSATPAAQSPEGAPAPSALHAKGAAGLPPPMIIESALRPAEAHPSSEASSPAASAVTTPESRAAAPKTMLVLQAISERDSRPIAIINDQLVKEGDRVGAARVLKIGADSVEVMLENGQRETVRFAPPPLPTPESQASPSPRL